MNQPWNVQQALTEMEARLNDRFDRLDEIPLVAARLDERVKVLEQKADWIVLGIGSSLLGVAGLIVSAIKHRFGW